jgi:type I restriction enzyme, S subunit
MAGEWREATVGDIASSSRNALVGGPFGSNLVSRDYVAEGVPVIRGQNMGSRWITGDFAFVTEKKARSLEANLARPGDIVFTQRGTLGQVSVIPPAPFHCYLVSQSQMKLTVDREIADPLFFYYVFTSAEQLNYMHQNAIQTGVPHTNLGILRAAPVPLPPLDEQHAIAHILGTLGDKIELNRRMNETLEAMARALFKSWFVDFEPVHAKAEGRDPGLPQDIADLFPDSFVDSELGKIPDRWSRAHLEDIANVTSGKRPEIQYPEPSELAQIPLWGGNGPMAFVPEAMINYPVLLTGRVGTLGSIFRIHSPCWPSDNTLIIKAKQPAAFEYLFLQLKRIDFIALNRGSTQPLLTQADLKAQALILPPPVLLKRFHAFAETLYSRIIESESESRTLAALRDELLPKLISVELRVRDAARFTSQVG